MSNEEIMKEWFAEDVSLDSATLAEFDQYVEEYCKVKDEQEAKEAELSAVNKKLQAMQTKLISYLEAQGKTKHVSRVGTISVVSRVQWKAPEGEGRDDVIQYLKARDQYDAVMAFNANKFSSWFSQERESNPNFDLKGVEQKLIKYISARR